MRSRSSRIIFYFVLILSMKSKYETLLIYIVNLLWPAVELLYFPPTSSLSSRVKACKKRDITLLEFMPSIDLTV